MQVETLDKLYLEYSQMTGARNSRELLAKRKADSIMNIVEHGAGTTDEKNIDIYNLAKEIYEQVGGEKHYWHLTE